ncbi:hypothetical protein Tco_0790130 [Tanacetum coccineum]
MPTLRTAEIDLIKNDEAWEINLDLIEEKIEQAAIQKAKLKWKNTTTLKSAAQVSNRGTWSTVTMMQATPKTEVKRIENGAKTGIFGFVSIKSA